MSLNEKLVNKEPEKPRKPRFIFTIDRDIYVLHTSLAKNPWQTGKHKWNDVQKFVMRRYGQPVTVRAIKERIDLLILNYNAQQLTSRTGTEEEKTERCRLLDSINTIIEEEKAAINLYHSADENIDDLQTGDDSEAINNGNCGDQNDTTNVILENNVDLTTDDPDVDIDQPNELVAKEIIVEQRNGLVKPIIDATSKSCLIKTTRTSTTSSAKKQRLADRAKADSERDQLLDETNMPNSTNKKARLTVEDEMILKRQEHEMMLDIEKLNLEKERLLLDKTRESRLEEEGRRHDALLQSHLIIQQAMLNMMTSIIQKQ